MPATSTLFRYTRRVVFHHVAKTAGTTVHAELARHWSELDTCPERGDLLDRIPYTDLARYTLFSGHYDKHNVDLIPGPKILATFLRDPAERIVSLYHYWRSYRWPIIEQKGLDGPRLAKSLDLVDFLRSDERLIRLNCDNAMARSFLGRHNAETWATLRGDPQTYAQWAVTNLSRYNFVGFVAHFDADMQRLRDLLGLPDDPIPRLNTFDVIPPIEVNVREPIERQALTPAVEAALAALTTIDRPFYAAALAMRDELGSVFPN